jgi:hypothetical protein
MRFSSPEQSIIAERYSDAFVDDAQNGLNDVGEDEQWDLETLRLKHQQLSQTWELLLFSSGGALKLSKCCYYLLYWEWKNGLPCLLPASKMHMEPIKLTLGRTQGLS